MMTRQSAEQIEDEAADWLARLDRYGQTPDLLRDLEFWLSGDERRNGALLQARAAWNLLNDEIAPVAPTQTLSDGDVEGENAHGFLDRLMPRRTILLGSGALAASVVAATVGWVALSPRQMPDEQASREGGDHYETMVGEIRRVPLTDGSTIAINTQTAVRVEMQPKTRIVRLASGEAWFQVAKDKARPFIAEAGAVRVRAVGTAFGVRRRDNGADVLVTQGIVDVWSVGSEDRMIRLTAGQRAFVPDSAPIVTKSDSSSEVDRALAWRSGQIDFDGESLSSAINEFNRYNERKIVLADQSIADEPLFGVFRTDDPEGFAQAVHHGFGVPISVSSDRIGIGKPHQ